jgi:hypothetical protein
MTVILHFKGGPRDGGFRRISSDDLEPGKQVVIETHRHRYCSRALWNLEDRVELFYQGRREKIDKSSKPG